MRRTILTTLRDGRSHFAAALGCLLLLAALIGGVHTGAMAPGEGGGRVAMLLCSHDANGSGSGRQPADPRADLCCVAGCLANAPALATPPMLLPEPGLAGSISATKMPVAVAARAETHPEHRPRGPPSLA